MKSMTASGNVKIVYDEIMATSNQALYDSSKRTITLTGGPPRLWRGPSMAVAQTVILHLDDNRTEFLGGDGGNEKEPEIKVIINPGKSKKEKK